MAKTNHVENAENEKDGWCYRAETTRLLSLSIAQIHMSLTEGDNSINTLSESFQELANICLKVESLAQSGSENTQATLTQVADVAENMSGQINQAIVAFQFYDRLCQRMEHVASSLDGLSGLLKSEENELEPVTGWRDLREQIRAHYTMKEEHLMFETIMQGASAKEAMNIYKESLAKKDDDDGDIELF